jgi:hypothetical protein
MHIMKTLIFTKWQAEIYFTCQKNFRLACHIFSLLSALILPSFPLCFNILTITPKVTHTNK